MSAKRHLRELQWRLMIVAAFFLIGASLAYTYQAFIVPALMAPLHGEQLFYLNPAGGFTFIFQVSIYAGMALAFPILLQQIYGFLKPVLPEKAQRKSAILIICSFLLLAAGIAFGYFVAVPNALAFLYGFADQYVDAALTADSYLNFVIAYTIGIGIVFQLPLVLLLIHTIKPLTPGGLMKSEKWVVLISFIIAAILTPTPDPVNQALIAGPVIVVYQLGVIAVLINIANTKRVTKRLAKKQVPTISVTEAVKITDVEEVPQSKPVTLTTAIDPEATPLQTYLAKTALMFAAPEPTEEAHLSELVEEVIAAPELAKAPQPKLIRTVDGIIMRRPAPLQVPSRPTTSVKEPQLARPAMRPTAPRRGFYVDGIIAPQQASGA